MSITINRLEEGHISYPLVCRRLAETVSLQRRQICYRWGTPAYWSLVPQSSMVYLFEFCLKNMWNCSLTKQILSHSFNDWKLCELFLLSGFFIWHAVYGYDHSNLLWSCYKYLDIFEIINIWIYFNVFLKWQWICSFLSRCVLSSNTDKTIILPD